MNKENYSPDYYLLADLGILVILGILILSSASAALSQAEFGNSYYFLNHQVTRGVLPGILAAFIAYKLPLTRLKKAAPFLLLLNLILLAMVFFPSIGFEAGGARRWVKIAFISFQPSEFLKLSFIIYLASWLVSRSEKRPDKKNKGSGEFGQTLIAFLIVLGTIGFFLMVQPDLSTFFIIALTGVCMYFLSETPLKHIFFMAILGIASFILFVTTTPYRLNRVIAWFFPELDPMGQSFQSNQALIMAGAGGIFGQGFGSSSSKYSVLPELIGDSIFAPYAYEMGFVGCVVLVFLFVIFIWRGVKIAKKTNDGFCKLVALGIVIWIIFQAFINIASTLKIIPVSGVPLPFISYGGTAIVTELIAVGILLNISKNVSHPRII